MLTTVIAFIVALGLLIAIHEYGHYRVAVACGVKVLRFSVGFGRPLLSWRRPGKDTEFVIAAFPLGGYVKMLDEREAPVPADQRHLAFNTQPLRKRAAIVAAGPAANLLLAVLLYAVVGWWGTQEPRAVLAKPVAGSLAERAGLVGGELVLAAAADGAAPRDVRSFEDLRWRLMRAALEGQDLRLWLAPERGSTPQERVLPLSVLDARDADARLLQSIGILGPWSRPEIGELMPGGAAERDGLRPGDLVLRVDGQRIVDGAQLRAIIRTAPRDGRVMPQQWQVRRDGGLLELTVTPALVDERGQAVGRIGAFVGARPEMVEVRLGAFEGLWRGVERTVEVSALTLKLIGRMLIGEASVKNLSGPLTIADYAGKSASMGVVAYLTFLALISVSLGVLNLLPLPVLDGGHLAMYAWEGATGRPISDAWMERLQRGGVAVLLVMMSIALFNDVTRLFG